MYFITFVTKKIFKTQLILSGNNSNYGQYSLIKSNPEYDLKVKSKSTLRFPFVYSITFVT